MSALGRHALRWRVTAPRVVFAGVVLTGASLVAIACTDPSPVAVSGTDDAGPETQPTRSARDSSVVTAPSADAADAVDGAPSAPRCGGGEPCAVGLVCCGACQELGVGDSCWGRTFPCWSMSLQCESERKRRDAGLDADPE